MHPQRRATPTDLLLVALFVAAPALLSLHLMGVRAPFEYFAEDAFYYLTVARESVGKPFYTFDGTHATNGFHPLWQWLLGQAIAAWPGRAHEAQVMIGIVLAGTALVTAGSLALASALLRAGVPFGAVLLSVLAAPFYLLVSFAAPHVGAIWSTINGMETPLTILCFGCMAWLIAGPWQARLRGPIGIGLLTALATLATLARLDDVFIFVPLFGFILWWRADIHRWRLCLAIGASVPTAVLGAYLAYNLRTVGVAVPISGLAKAGFSLHMNLVHLVAAFTPIDALTGHIGWAQDAFAGLQTALPPLCLALWLQRRRIPARIRSREGLSTLEAVITAGTAYVVCKAAYNLLNVHLNHQGFWYMPIPIWLGSFVLADWLFEAPVFQSSRWLGRVTALVLSSFLLTAWIEHKQWAHWHEVPYRIWHDGGRLRERLLARDPNTRLLETIDGIHAFGTGLPSLSATALSGDVESLRAHKAGRLMDLAWLRGHRTLALPPAVPALGGAPLPPDETVGVISGHAGQSVANIATWMGDEPRHWRAIDCLWDRATAQQFVTFGPVPGYEPHL